MKKRFNLTWRVITALLLILALVPALVVGVAAAETTPPTLLSISWVDTVADGRIGGGDSLIFYFSESMDVSTLNDVTLVNARLDSTATGTNDYGSTLANITWGLGDTRLTVLLGLDCSDTLAGKWVNPTADVKDKAGNSDATAGNGRQIPVAPDATDTLAPYLVSITWVDGGNGIIDIADFLYFQFSESMDDTIVNIGNVDTLLQITGTEVPETLAATALTWQAGNTVMIATLGALETIDGGELACATGFQDWHVNTCTVPSTCPSVPLPPNAAAPILVDVVWTDQGGVGYGQGDILTFRFSETIDTLAILGIGVANIQNYLQPSSGHTYGLGGATAVSEDATGSMIYVTLGPADPLMVNAGDTITPVGVAPNDITDKGHGTAIAKTCIANVVTLPATTAAMPTTNIRETTAPTLRSISWFDANANGIYDAVGPDTLNFYFSESLNPGTLGGIPADRIFVNQRLDSTATPGNQDYGTLGATTQVWIGASDSNLQVSLGTNEIIDGGEYVNPSSLITDMYGNPDGTTGNGSRIPLPPDTTHPTLLSVVWIDVDGLGRINAGDDLIFNFAEAMRIASFTGVYDTDLKVTGNDVVESFGAGAVGVWAFGDGLPPVNWACQLTITLGAGETIDGGETVNPADYITDAIGNPDITVTPGPSIPLPPDITQPTLLNNIVWNDIDGNGMIDALDQFVLSWSESMAPATIIAANVNTVLESTAFGAGADYGGAGLQVIWNSPADTQTTIILGAGETFIGGEWVNPDITVTDRFGNPDATAGAGAQFPTVAGTPPTIVRSPATLTFTAEINGSNPANQSVSITNSGQQTLNWAVSNTQPWLSLSPASGTNAGTVTATVNISGLNVSTYNDTITITAAGATNTPQTVPVTLTISVPATPTPTATANASPTPTATANVTPTPTTTITPTPTATPGGSTGSGTVGTSGGTVATTDGKIEITFPDGAFDASTTVTITGGSCTHGDTDEFVVGSTCFSVTPTGALGAEATICVQLSSYDLSLGDEGDLTLGYWADGTWNVASDITITDDTICGKTSDLSDWAVLSSTGEGWVWWYWALIGGGAFIVVLAIILLIALPKRGKGEEIPSEELYGEEEEEF